MRCSTTWLLVLGGFFILVVRFLPKGLVGLVESLLARFPVGSEEEQRRSRSSGRCDVPTGG